MRISVMVYKKTVALSLLACSIVSLTALHAAPRRTIEITETIDVVQPQNLIAFLQQHAPTLVQYISQEPTELETQLFSTIAQTERGVLLKFFISGCGPCKQMTKVVDTVAKQFSDSLLVINIELTDASRYLMDAFNGRGVPTLVFFKDGKKVEQYTGNLTVSELTSKIKKIAN